MTDGEPARLIELWAGAALAVVVDAVRTDPPRPGRVHEQALEAVGRDGLDPPASSHALGLEHAVELGTALDRMPGRLRVYAIEGADFDFGVGLTPEVEAAVATVAARVEALLRGPACESPER
ncbi:hydrogenase maturation protease [Actinomadura viridis]|uniref:hydrogenase maturation protease n=1 Tax=Actinomadura viridis TaxID=58110 RepID=UPI0036C5B83D